MRKKAQIAQLQPIIVALVSVAIVLVVGFLIMAQVKTQATALEGENGSSVNATSEVVDAMDDIPGWLPIIVVTVIGSLLIGLVAYFKAR